MANNAESRALPKTKSKLVQTACGKKKRSKANMAAAARRSKKRLKKHNDANRAPRIWIGATKQKYAVRKGTAREAAVAAQAARAKKTTWEPQEWKEHLEEVMAPFRKGVMHGGNNRRCWRRV